MLAEHVEEAAPPRWRLDLSALFAYLALGAVFSAIPLYVTEDLGGSKGMGGFAVSIFFVAAILTRPLAGRWVDRHGRQGVLRVAPFVLALLFVALLAAHSIPVVLVVRFLQGVAGSAFYVAAVSASTDLGGADARGAAVARLSLALYAGFATGPLIGERLLDLGPAAAWLTLAALEVVAGLVIWALPETRPVPAPTDAGIGTPARTVLFHRAALVTGILLLTLGFGYAAITSQSSLYAKTIGLASSAPLYLAFSGSILLVRLVAGRLSDRVGALRVLYPGVATLAAGLALMAALQQPVPAVLGVAMVGTGWALVFPAAVSYLSDLVPDEERGAVLGSAIALMDVGQGVAGYAVGAIADRAGFGAAYALPAGLAVAGLVVFAVFRAPNGRPVAANPGTDATIAR